MIFDKRRKPLQLVKPPYSDESFKKGYTKHFNDEVSFLTVECL